VTTIRSWDGRVTITVDVREPTEATRFCDRIADGDFDEDLEGILEAAHHRKRELRDKRRGR